MYNIMLNKKSEVECALNALVKRAAKKGLPELKYSFGKAFVQKERIIHPKYGMGFYLDIEVERIPLIIEGTPQFSGWSFIATIEHLDRDNIVIHSIKQDDNDRRFKQGSQGWASNRYRRTRRGRRVPNGFAP